jgi:hypothetical protein
MSFETGASTSSVYNTVHHAFMNITRIRKGGDCQQLYGERAFQIICPLTCDSILTDVQASAC